MISYIKGELAEISEQSVVVECGGIGYEISVPASAASELLHIGSEVKIYTYLYVREDAVNLYGFLTRDDLAVFKMLIGVNGIGPKGALGILSAITPDDLRFAILADDVKTIAKAPGIGAKTAQKMIIELRDKMKLSDVFEQKLMHEQGGEQDIQNASGDIRHEAIQALVALGYSTAEATKAVRRVEPSDDMTVEMLLKEALKRII